MLNIRKRAFNVSRSMCPQKSCVAVFIKRIITSLFRETRPAFAFFVRDFIAHRLNNRHIQIFREAVFCRRNKKPHVAHIIPAYSANTALVHPAKLKPVPVGTLLNIGIRHIHTEFVAHKAGIPLVCKFHCLVQRRNKLFF